MGGGFDEAQHPRDDRGKFTAGDWASARAGKLAGPLLGKAEREGGFSYRPGAGRERVPKTGYMVSRPVAEGLNHVIDIKEMASRDPAPSRAELEGEIRGRVEKWLAKTLPSIDKEKDQYLGGWMERHNDGKPVALHLDVSQRFQDRDKATKAGRERNQMAIWHLDKGEEIPTGGTGR